MTIKEKQEKAIEEHNEIVETQSELRKQYEELEQNRLLKLGEVQAYTEILQAEEADVDENANEPKTPKKNQTAE
jgi:hypothetical protein